jgi:uncharacterized membrane protein
MRVTRCIEVRAPADAIWDLVAEPANAAELMAGVTRWDIEGDRETGKGARYRVLMQVGSAQVGGLVEVVEFDPCRDLAWTSVSGVDHRGRWRLRQQAGGRTKAELRLSYGAPGGLLGLVADRFAAPMVRRNLRETLERVRDRAEERVSPGRGGRRR